MSFVLIVEDDPYNAALFKKVLEKRGGFTVVVTEDASEAVRQCASGAVDLVLMDVSLTNTTWEGRMVSGTELCRILKSDPTTAGVPVVLATAHAMRGDAESLIAESGADDYIAKPVLDHDAFVEHVRSRLRKAA